MANVINPATMGWLHSGKNTDLTAFTAQQYTGTELSLDGKPAVSIPAAFATDGKYSIPTAGLTDSLPNGTHTAAFRIVAVNGNKSGLSPAGSFDIDRRVPDAPFAVSFA